MGTQSESVKHLVLSRPYRTVIVRLKSTQGCTVFALGYLLLPLGGGLQARASKDCSLKATFALHWDSQCIRGAATFLSLM